FSPISSAAVSRKSKLTATSNELQPTPVTLSSRSVWRLTGTPRWYSAASAPASTAPCPSIFFTASPSLDLACQYLPSISPVSPQYLPSISPACLLYVNQDTSCGQCSIAWKRCYHTCRT